MLLHRYYFEHPNSEKSVTVGGWSYLWAGLLGVVFVWWAGAGNLLHAVTANIAFALLTFLLVSVASFLPEPIPALALVMALPVIVFVQGLMMVSIIRTGYRRRGWLIRTD